MRIRGYDPADLVRCREIIGAAVLVMDGLNEAARVHVQESNTTMRLGNDLAGWVTVVAESSGRVLGLGALDGDEVKRVYVDPLAHGQGVATALMSKLEATAQESGVSTVRVDASPSAVPFYESLGYARISDETLTIGPAVFDFVQMSKPLGG